MNTTRTTTGKLIEKIGTVAAYSFWISSALVVIGLFAVLYSFDTPSAYRVGQLFALNGFVLLGSIGVLVTCAKILKARGEY